MEDPLYSLTLKALESGSSNMLLDNSPKKACLVYRECNQLQLHDVVGHRRGPSDNPKDK